MKRDTSLLGVFLLLGVLAGCGGGASSTTSGNNNGGSNGGGTLLPAGSELLYVGDNAGLIHGFGVDPNSGKLTPLANVLVTNGAAAGDVSLTADLGGKVLYATSEGLGSPNVASFLVHSATGTLTPVAGSPMLSVPPRKVAAGLGVFVLPDPSANSAQVFSFNIDGFTGALSASQTFALPGVPHDLTAVLSNTTFWVGIAIEGNSGGEIAGIFRDPNTGTVGLLPGAPTSTGGDNPQGIRATPDGKFVVVANQATNNLSVFSLNSSTGALAAVPGSPFASGSAPGPVAIDPSGKFVFVGNTGGNSLSAYTIDSAGSLTAVTGTPIPLGANAQPSSIAVNPAGKLVYVSVAPQQVAGFALDPSTGVLTPVAGSPFSVGAATRDMVFIP